MQVTKEKSLSRALIGILRSGKGADAKFSVGTSGDIIEGHKVILMARSPVFEEMFSEHWYCHKYPVFIPDYDPPIFRKFLEFMYGDVFNPTFPEAIILLYMAHEYLVDPLIVLCEDFIKANLKIGNAAQVFEIASRFNQTELMKLAGTMMARNLKELQGQGDFFWIHERTLKFLLTSKDLVLDECSIFKFVLSWAKYTIGKESSWEAEAPRVLKNILPLIRFHAMTAKEFADVVVPTKVLPPQTVIDMFVYFVGSKKAGHGKRASSSQKTHGSHRQSAGRTSDPCKTES